MKTFIVTVKLARLPARYPRAKVTARCPVSTECTDQTGEHHSLLWLAETAAEIREFYAKINVHVTRIEEAVRPMQLVMLRIKDAVAVVDPKPGRYVRLDDPR